MLVNSGGQPPDKPNGGGTGPPPRSYAAVTGATPGTPEPIANPTPAWFQFKEIPLPSVTVNNTPACLFSSTEWDLTSKQSEHALVMKFSTGTPTLPDIKLHIRLNWNLKMEPVISLLHPCHVLILPTSYEDMIMEQSHEKHLIETSPLRLFRWTKDFKFGKDSTIVPIWICLPYLPFPLHNPSYLQRIGNTIGKFLRADAPTQRMQNLMQARICVEVDVSKPFVPHIWIGKTKEDGFMQHIDYEGNNAFCTECELLGQVVGVCRKGQLKPAGKVSKSTANPHKEDKNKGKKIELPPVTRPDHTNPSTSNLRVEPKSLPIINQTVNSTDESILNKDTEI